MEGIVAKPVKIGKSKIDPILAGCGDMVIPVLLLGLRCLDGPEQTVRFIVDAGGEKQRVGLVPLFTAENDAPQSVNGNGLSGLVLKLAQEGAGARIEGIDSAIAEIADQQVVAKLAEIVGRQCQAPRR